MKAANYILFIFALVFALHTHAQQDPHFSLYRYNGNVINPAYAGSADHFEAQISARSQWSGIVGGPETFNFNLNTPVGERVGLGLSIVSDDVFVLSETHMYADFSYRLPLSEELDLYLGLKAGGSFLDINLNGLVEGDPLFAQDVNSFNPNIGAGLYLVAKKYYVTVSAPGILKGDRFEKENNAPVTASDNIHFFAGGGYDIEINDNFSLRPSTLAKFVSGAPLSIDLTASALFNKKFELGINYRLEESYTGFATVEVNKSLRIGYAYERATTIISDFNNGTHEFVLKFLIRNKNKVNDQDESYQQF